MFWASLTAVAAAALVFLETEPHSIAHAGLKRTM